MKKCPYCEFESDNEKICAGHIANCKNNDNLNLNDRNKRISERMLSFNKIKFPKVFKKIKCLYCDTEFEIELSESKFSSGKYKKCCCKECAYKYSSSKVDRNKTKTAYCKECGTELSIKMTASIDNVLCDKCKQTYIKSHRKIFKLKIKKENLTKEEVITLNKCNYCGEEKCQKPEICSKLRLIPGLIKRFGFDKDVIGTLKFYDEYERVRNMLIDDYHNKELSLPEMCIKYNHDNDRNFSKILESLGIKRRNLSDSQKNLIRKGKKMPSCLYPYKRGFHTNWEGKNIFFRSSYEEEFCKQLDESKIRYDVEKIRIEYFDTQKNEKRIAIPDFYLVDTNEIIEIKSSWTYDEQNMIDKFKAYKDLGYNVKLFLDKKEKEI